MLEQQGNPFVYYLLDSLKQWYCWVWVAIVAALSILIYSEEQDSFETTRQRFVLQLNFPYYAYMVFIGLFVPLVFKGARRFETFLACTNSIFVLGFLTLLNPFYWCSYRYPRLEHMTRCRIGLFACFELLAHLCAACAHLAWGYFLVQGDAYNYYYSTISRATYYETSVIFCTSALNPCLMLCFNGFLQLLCRCVKSILDRALYDDEDCDSYRYNYFAFRKNKRRLYHEDQRVERRCRYRSTRTLVIY